MRPARLRLTLEDIRLIKRLKDAGVPDAGVARMLGVSRVQVWRVRTGRSRSREWAMALVARED